MSCHTLAHQPSREMTFSVALTTATALCLLGPMSDGDYVLWQLASVHEL